MGEAKQRAAARAAGKPWRMPLVCPRCKSTEVRKVTSNGAKMLSDIQTTYSVCRACKTVWESYPADWCEDVVGATPCDNCAFRADSPESLDNTRWKELIAALRQGGEFLCHKGVPIIEKPPGFFSFDMEAMPQQKRRWCAGFARLIWAMRDKGDDWLKKRLESVDETGTAASAFMNAEAPKQ